MTNESLVTFESLTSLSLRANLVYSDSLLATAVLSVVFATVIQTIRYLMDEPISSEQTNKTLKLEIHFLTYYQEDIFGITLLDNVPTAYI